MKYWASELEEVGVVQEVGKDGKRRLMVIRYLADQDAAEHEISEVYFRMQKSYRLMPSLMRPPPSERLRVLENALSMVSPSSLRQKVHLLNEKFKIVVRSFGSIHSNEGIGLFLVEQLSKSRQFQSILLQNGVSEGSFLDWIRGQRGQRYLEYLTDRSKYFQSCIGWYINMYTKNKDRIIRDLEYFFNIRYREIMTIKIIVPADSKQLLEFVFPIFLQKLLQLTRFSQSGLIKTVEFIVSSYDEDRIRESLLQGVYNHCKSRCIKIQTFSPLQLSLFSVQKMVELKLFTVEYCPQRRPARPAPLSSLASTIFVHEATKTTITRKLLVAVQSDVGNAEFVLNLHMEKVFAVGRGGVKQERWGNMGAQMRQLVQLVRCYYPNMDMLVIYGSQDMQRVEINLFHCTIINNNNPLSMVKVEVDLQKRKMALLSQQIYDIKFAFNKDKERFMIETHEKEVEQVRKLLKESK